MTAAEYRRQVREATARYDAAIASLKAALEAGEITALESATARIDLMEAYLREVRQARKEVTDES